MLGSGPPAASEAAMPEPRPPGPILLNAPRQPSRRQSRDPRPVARRTFEIHERIHPAPRPNPSTPPLPAKRTRLLSNREMHERTTAAQSNPSGHTAPGPFETNPRHLGPRKKCTDEFRDGTSEPKRWGYRRQADTDWGPVTPGRRPVLGTRHPQSAALACAIAVFAYDRSPPSQNPEAAVPSARQGGAQDHPSRSGSCQVQ